MILYLPHRPRGHAVAFKVWPAAHSVILSDNMPWRILMCLSWQCLKAGDVASARGILSRRLRVARVRP